MNEWTRKIAHCSDDDEDEDDSADNTDNDEVQFIYRRCCQALARYIKMIEKNLLCESGAIANERSTLSDKTMKEKQQQKCKLFLSVKP